MDELLTERRFETAMAEQRACLDKHMAEQRACVDKHMAEQSIAIAELKSAICPYLWIHGCMIVLVLTSLYTLVESWMRG